MTTARAAYTQLLAERSWSLFVDGENFTRRGQEVLKAAGISTRNGPARRDVFLWLPAYAATTPFFGLGRGPGRLGGATYESARRAYYYTSSPSGEPEWTESRLALRAIGFEPRLFPRRSGRSKAVDIALATESLVLAVEERTEVTVIFSGDGDYVPVVEAMKRLGQRVIVGAFAENGTNPEMIIAADAFIDLTTHLVERWTRFQEQLERERRIKSVETGTEEAPPDQETSA